MRSLKMIGLVEQVNGVYQLKMENNHTIPQSLKNVNTSLNVIFQFLYHLFDTLD